MPRILRLDLASQPAEAVQMSSARDRDLASQ
jgi:hypothetical protein